MSTSTNSSGRGEVQRVQQRDRADRGGGEHDLLVLGETDRGDPDQVFSDVHRHLAEKVERPVLVVRWTAAERGDADPRRVTTGEVDIVGRVPARALASRPHRIGEELPWLSTSTS